MEKMKKRRSLNTIGRRIVELKDIDILKSHIENSKYGQILEQLINEIIKLDWYFGARKLLLRKSELNLSNTQIGELTQYYNQARNV